MDYSGSWPHYSMSFDFDGGKMQCSRYGNVGTTPSTTYNDGNWHYVFIYYNGTRQGMYVDGSHTEHMGANSGSLGTTLGDMIMGKEATTSFYVGYIDMLYIYTRALSLSEMDQLYNGGAGI